MKYFVACLFGILAFSSCAQVQDQGARSLENAGSVVTSGGQRLWTAPEKSVKEQKEEEELKNRSAATR